MEFIVRSLRAFAVPLVVPLPRTGRLFDDGELTDEGFRNQLELLGSEVVRAARQMRATGTCDYDLNK
jgi:FMN reductase